MDYFLINDHTGMYANEDSTGEHDVVPVKSLLEAKSFETWAEAAKFSQNFGADWRVEEL